MLHQTIISEDDQIFHGPIYSRTIKRRSEFEINPVLQDELLVPNDETQKLPESILPVGYRSKRPLYHPVLNEYLIIQVSGSAKASFSP